MSRAVPGIITLLNYTNVVRETMSELRQSLAYKLHVPPSDVRIELRKLPDGRLLPKVDVKAHVLTDVHVTRVVDAALPLVSQAIDVRMRLLAQRWEDVPAG